MDISLWQYRLRPLLTPVSRLYAGVMRLRRLAYDAGVLNSYRPLAQVVSVGNISWGGTGKTPVCSWLLDRAARAGLKTALISRGYRGRSAELPLTVTPSTPAGQCGDEPLMLARANPLSRVVVDPLRSRAAAFLEQNALPDVIVLDDAFQHLGIRRDIDLVLLRPVDLADQWDRVIPAGSWREPASALHSARCFLIRTPEGHTDLILNSARRRLGSLGRPIFTFNLKPSGLHWLEDDSPAPHPTSYILFSGVGSPDSVLQTATELFGFPPARHLVYPDHHAYTPSDLDDIAALAERAGSVAVCTAKDAVKIRPELLPNAAWISVEVEFGPGLNAVSDFPAWMDAQLKVAEK